MHDNRNQSVRTHLLFGARNIILQFLVLADNSTLGFDGKLSKTICSIVFIIAQILCYIFVDLTALHTTLLFSCIYFCNLINIEYQVILAELPAILFYIGCPFVVNIITDWCVRFSVLENAFTLAALKIIRALYCFSGFDAIQKGFRTFISFQGQYVCTSGFRSYYWVEHTVLGCDPVSVR